MIRSADRLGASPEVLSRRLLWSARRLLWERLPQRNRDVCGPCSPLSVRDEPTRSSEANVSRRPLPIIRSCHPVGFFMEASRDGVTKSADLVTPSASGQSLAADLQRASREVLAPSPDRVNRLASLREVPETGPQCPRTGSPPQLPRRASDGSRQTGNEAAFCGRPAGRSARDLVDSGKRWFCYAFLYVS